MPGTGPIAQFFTEDHRRLDVLLQRSSRADGTVDMAAYGELRQGLLAHIGMEEKLLLPLARQKLGRRVPGAKQLRADHAALAALLVPTPTVALLEQLRDILVPHNELEERPGGVYDVCESLAGDEAADLLERLRAFPPVKLAPHYDGQRAHDNIARMLEARTRVDEEA